MTISRESQVSLETTTYYHVVSRCVRRAFLCGDDPLMKKNFDHRKQWLVEYIRFLSSVFSLKVCAYAVMSNHCHLVLHVDQYFWQCKRGPLLEGMPKGVKLHPKVTH